MRNMLGILRCAGQTLSASGCLLLVACSSSDGGSTAAVLTQAPHCSADTSALKIEGTIAGAAIDDSRTDPNINAGQENFTSGKFYTPFAGTALASNQLALTFTWNTALFFGQTAAISGGNLTLPANHPQAGAKYCVSKGEVGFVDGGSENGALKFAINEVKAGEDCSGAAAAVDLRGCFQ